jgi:hypothetical protein
MPDINKANRQVCDLDIRILETHEPFLFFDTANTNTTTINSDAVYAMAKGARKIAFQNPLEGTLTVEAQVYPTKLFALMADGVIDTEATFAHKERIKCSTAGQLTITGAESGTVFVYKDGEFGNSAKLIAGTYASNTFTATTASDIAVNDYCEVGYIKKVSSGLNKVAFNNQRLPKDYYITALTVEKEEDGTLVPFKMTYYKASVQRNFEISFSSEGDPASLTVTFDLLEDKDENFIDFIEITS